MFSACIFFLLLAYFVYIVFLWAELAIFCAHDNPVRILFHSDRSGIGSTSIALHSAPFVLSAVTLINLQFCTSKKERSYG